MEIMVSNLTFFITAYNVLSFAIQTHTTLTKFFKTCINQIFFSFFPVALRPNAGHGLLIHEVSRSHNDASQSVGLLWTSDQLVAETSI